MECIGVPIEVFSFVLDFAKHKKKYAKETTRERKTRKTKPKHFEL